MREPVTYALFALLLVGLTIFAIVRAAISPPRRDRIVTLAVCAWVVAFVFMTVRPGSGLGVRLNLIPIFVDGPGSAFDAILNVLVVVPLGMLLASAGWRVRRTLLVALGASLGVEITQYLTNWGRTADVNDLITNVVGATLGWAVVWLIQRGRRSPAPE